jgi:hypothetical protein
MPDPSNMREQAKRTAMSRDRAKAPAEKNMLASQNRFYEAMSKSEPPAPKPVQTKLNLDGKGQ